MKEVKNGQVPINYEMTGQGNTTLLFVHGSFIDKKYWSEQVKRFSPHYTVITMDLAAHGQSGRNRNAWTVEDFGKDVVAVLKQLSLQRVILVGHSMGADAVLEAAVALPQAVAGLVAVDFFKNAGTPLPKEFEQQAAGIIQGLKNDFSNVSEQYARMALLTEKTDAAVVNRVVKDYRNAYPQMGWQSTESIFNYFSRERQLLQQLAFKLYLINVDYMPTNEKLLKEYAHSGYKLSTIHGTSHYPMIEEPDEFNRILGEVITEIERNIRN